MFRSGLMKIRFSNVPSRDTSASKPQAKNEYSSWNWNGPKISGCSAAAGLAITRAVAITPAIAATIRTRFISYLLRRLLSKLRRGPRPGIGARPELRVVRSGSALRGCTTDALVGLVVADGRALERQRSVGPEP